MDMKDIQELIKMVRKSEISGLKIKQGDFEITIKNSSGEAGQMMVPVSTHQQVITSHQPVANQSVSQTSQPIAVADDNKAAEPPIVKSDKQIQFKSPMIGTFYRKPGVDKDPFVKVGDKIKPGQVLCVVEAMKLFNEIEWDGAEATITKILIEDAVPVEYDQPLFLIELA